MAYKTGHLDVIEIKEIKLILYSRCWSAKSKSKMKTLTRMIKSDIVKINNKIKYVKLNKLLYNKII